MAKLTITLADLGQTVPLTGTLFWEVFGTSNVETFAVSAGTKATISSGGGVDRIQLLGSITDYTVKLAGSSAVFTHTTSAQTVTVPMTTAGDEVQFGTAGTPLVLKIVPATGTTPTTFILGSQELETTDAPITGSDGSETTVDGQGTPDTPVTLPSASTGAFQFTDSVTVANNVRIIDFGADDRITVLGATATDYNSAISSNAAGDVTLSFNNNGTLNSIVLLGVASGSPVFDVASFNALPVGDLLFV